MGFIDQIYGLVQNMTKAEKEQGVSDGLLEALLELKKIGQCYDGTSKVDRIVKMFNSAMLYCTVFAEPRENASIKQQIAAKGTIWSGRKDSSTFEELELEWIVLFYYFIVNHVRGRFIAITVMAGGRRLVNSDP